MTKKEQCKVDLLSMWGSKHPIEKMRKEYHEYCPKSKSNNIVFCTKKIIKRKKDKKVQWINDYFKNFGKKRKPGRKGNWKTGGNRKRKNFLPLGFRRPTAAKTLAGSSGDDQSRR